MTPVLKTQAVGKFVKETTKEIGGELIKLGVASLAEAALDSFIDDEKDSCDKDSGWWTWFKGNGIKKQYSNTLI